MSFSCIADHSFSKLTDISPSFLKEHGIKFLLLDLDNTVAPYGQDEPESDVLCWADGVKASGVTLFIVSNSHKSERVSHYAGKLGIKYINRAAKPFPKGIIESMRLCGAKAEETALVGDQSFTDVMGAKSAGITALLVHPICLKNPLLAARYFVELPWRALCRNRSGRL